MILFIKMLAILWAISLDEQVLSTSGAEARKLPNRASWDWFCRLLEPRSESHQIEIPETGDPTVSKWKSIVWISTARAGIQLKTYVFSNMLTGLTRKTCYLLVLCFLFASVQKCCHLLVFPILFIILLKKNWHLPVFQFFNDFQQPLEHVWTY